MTMKIQFQNSMITTMKTQFQKATELLEKYESLFGKDEFRFTHHPVDGREFPNIKKIRENMNQRWDDNMKTRENMNQKWNTETKKYSAKPFVM